MLQERLMFWAVHSLAKGGLVSSPHLGPGWTKQTVPALFLWCGHSVTV